MRSPFLGAVVALCVTASAASTCDVDASSRTDCGYTGIDQSSCEAKGCCWSAHTDDDAGTVPWCFYAGAGETGYSLTSSKQSDSSFTGTLEALSSDSGISTLSLEVTMSDNDLVRVRITDASAARWEVPEDIVPATPATTSQSSTKQYDFAYTENPFTFTVTRVADGAVLFDSSASLTFQDQYIELTTSLDSTSSLFGIGEATRSDGMRLTPGLTATLWARDMPAAAFDTNLYGSHPFYLNLQKDGSAHGVLLRNSNGMDVTYASSADSLTYHVIGGVIDLFVFSGSTPAQVSEQYTRLIGRPTMMPYWSLGFHQCRYGYNDLGDVEAVWQNYTDANIPLDNMWIDIDYMANWKDWSYDSTNFASSDVNSFVSALHENGQHFVLIADPGILAVDPSWDIDYKPYTDGLEMDVFVKDGFNNEPYMTQVWPGPTYMPDWFHPNVSEYWGNSITDFWNVVPFDGLWTDMNEVSNFCNDGGTGQVCENSSPDTCPTGNVDTQTNCCLSCQTVDSTNALDFPPYKINNDDSQQNLAHKTMPMSAVHFDGKNTIEEYNVHNLFGIMEAKLTAESLTTTRGGRRPFVLSRSTFPSHGAHAAHWTGDNAATWNDLAASTVTVMNFALFGIPMVGSDICGFLDDTTEELCARWAEVGAFHPFSRNHNTYGAAPQEYYRWDSVAQAARNAYGLRYSLLPFLYTLMANAQDFGDLVARPLWANYPADSNTHGIDDQFMLGDSILVSPVITEGSTSVDAYFPAGTWFSMFNTLEEYDDNTVTSAGALIDNTQGGYETLATPLTATNVHVLAGSILPLHSAGALTTTAARDSAYRLLVVVDSTAGATGDVFLDDGGDVEGSAGTSTIMSYSASSSGLKATVASDQFSGAADMTLGSVTVVNVDKASSAQLTVGSKTCTPTIAYNSDKLRLTMDVSSCSLAMNTAFTLSWK